MIKKLIALANNLERISRQKGKTWAVKQVKAETLATLEAMIPRTEVRLSTWAPSRLR